MTKQLLRPKEAASRMGISIQTLYRMFDRGELSRVKITGRSVGIPKVEVDKILNPEMEGHGDLEVR